MEDLKQFCRLCGGNLSARCVEKTKLRDLILRSLDLDVFLDDSRFHPPSVCMSCDRKMSRWQKNRNARKIASLDITLHNFSLCEPGSSGETSKKFLSYESAARAEGLTTVVRGKQLFVITIDQDGNTEKCLSVTENGEVELKVHGKTVATESLFPSIQAADNVEEISQILQTLKSSKVCPGIPDFNIPPDMLRSRPVYIHHFSSSSTIRHINCSLLNTHHLRCGQCRIYRSDLAKLQHRIQLCADSSPAPKTNFRFLNKDRLTKRLSKSKRAQKQLKQRICHLEDKIATNFQARAHPIPMEDNEAFAEILDNKTATVHEHFPADTPMRLLWDEQIKHSQEHPQARRWHPSILRLCIALESKSSSAYDLLRSSGVLILPHKRTLKQYTRFTSSEPGFNKDLLKRVCDDINVAALKDHQKNITLTFDEMKISEGLVYSHSTGQIIGFTSLGTLNDELEAYSKSCMDGQASPAIASHVLTLMIRAICYSYKAPVAYFSTLGVTSDQLYGIVLAAVELLELQGFHVRALASDGAAPNRSFYDMVKKDKDDCFFIHPTTKKPIYLFSDVPHLLKTCRNNLENSGYHSKTRNLMFRGLPISWLHILDAYEWDMERTTGLRMLHRLTEDHLHLTPAHRMKVKLAAQVLSSTVANALRVQGRENTKSTILFIEYIDSFFDMLNVSNVHTGRKKKKLTLEPYRDVGDWRFTWLEEDFLSFLEEWSSEGHLTSLSATEREKLCLSKQTLNGLIMTVKSFVALTKQMLTEPGVNYILSDKFSQDPLEEYFSKQRGMGGSHDNPSVVQFGSNMQTLQVAGACVKASKRSNVQTDAGGSQNIDDTPLPRKKLFK